ncbi:MAG: glycosyltransferase [Acidobacteria bacterium]|nr:glycosyltransferase [Acidobacteriota bacterium]
MKILWLKTELLHPVDKGGKIRTYQMLRQLKRDHFITYLTLCDPGDAPSAYAQASDYSHRLVPVVHRPSQKFSAGFYYELGMNLGSPLPYAIQRYRSTAMQQAIENELRQIDYDVVVCDFLTPSVNLPASVNVPTVLFQHNVEAVIWERHYQNETNKLKKAYFFNQWRKMHNYERKACQRFDSVIAVSAVDRDLMREEFAIEQVYDVPTGVDTEYFAPQHHAANPYELVFTGSMDWMPNEDAILYFAAEILPAIATQIPDVHLTVVGRKPSSRVIALGESDARIEVTGRVDDVRPYLDRAAAYVVPIRVGGGTRLKIYEAMAMAKPVISTTIGAEGLAVRNGEDVLIADAPQAFAKAVTAVLQEQAFAQRLGEVARQVVCEQFGWSRVASAFAQVCERVQRKSLAARAA